MGRSRQLDDRERPDPTGRRPFDGAKICGAGYWLSSRRAGAEDVPRIPLDAVRALLLAFEVFRDEVARFYGLSVLETQAVSHLVAAGELGPTELNHRLGVTPGSVTALLDRLGVEGLVERRPHPNGRRRSVVTLTRVGWDQLADSSRWFSHAIDGVEETAVPGFVRHLDLVTTGNLDRQRAAEHRGPHGPSARAAPGRPRFPARRQERQGEPDRHVGDTRPEQRVPNVRSRTARPTTDGDSHDDT